MKYSKTTKNKVRSLRKQGLSLNQIYSLTSVPKTTIRTWITDISLSPEQLDIIRKRIQTALQEGRIKAQISAKIVSEKEKSKNFEIGKNEVGTLSKRDMFISGISLYWAEGFKSNSERRLGFCNSDSKMIIFYIKWLKTVLGIEKSDLIARVSINLSHKERTRIIERYWSEATGIPLDQFTKPFYQNSKWKRQYVDENYYGVIRVHVKNSKLDLWKMRGWIEGLIGT